MDLRSALINSDRVPEVGDLLRPHQHGAPRAQRRRPGRMAVPRQLVDAAAVGCVGPEPVPGEGLRAGWSGTELPLAARWLRGAHRLRNERGVEVATSGTGFFRATCPAHAFRSRLDSRTASPERRSGGLRLSGGLRVHEQCDRVSLLRLNSCESHMVVVTPSIPVGVPSVS